MNITILAAGKGTRLMPLTREMPKPLLKIKGESILLRTLKMIFEDDVNHNVEIVVGYKNGKIIDELKDNGFGDISIIFNEHFSSTNTFYSSSISHKGQARLVMDGDIYWKEIPKLAFEIDTIFGIPGAKEGETRLVPDQNDLIVKYDREALSGKGFLWGGGYFISKNTAEQISEVQINNSYIEDVLLEIERPKLLKLGENSNFEIDDLEDAKKIGINLNFPNDYINDFSNWFFGKNASLEMFDSGLSSNAYNLVLDDCQYVITIPTESESFDEIFPRKHKYNVMNILRGDVADYFVNFIPSRNILISKKISGRKATASDLNKIFVELEKMYFHQSGRIFNPIARIKKHFSGELLSRAIEINEKNLAGELVLIHGDMNPGNAIISKGKAKLIDFDFSADYSTAYDKAMTLVNFRVAHENKDPKLSDNIFLASLFSLSLMKEIRQKGPESDYIKKYTAYLEKIIKGK